MNIIFNNLLIVLCKIEKQLLNQLNIFISYNIEYCNKLYNYLLDIFKLTI